MIEGILNKKLHWARLPTPVEKMERLSQELGVNLWLKREDQTGFEWSGNKIRKLEFLVQDALEKGATCLITCGGVQSNHCRATAAIAARLGMRCVLFLRGQKPEISEANHLLDELLGAEIFYLTNEQYYEGMADFRKLVSSQISSQGGKTYFIPEGGSNEVGCLGYVSAFQEIVSQLDENAAKQGPLPPQFDSIVFAHGSGGTQAGLVLGKVLEKSKHGNTRIVAVNVCYDEPHSRKLVKDHLWHSIHQHKLPISFAAQDIEILDGFIGLGYAQNTEEELEFILRVARLEGVIFDPVYTGKALLALHQTIKREKKAFGENILFLHTGGGFGAMKPSLWQRVLKK